jgi:hypothetical protein
LKENELFRFREISSAKGFWDFLATSSTELSVGELLEDRPPCARADTENTSRQIAAHSLITPTSFQLQFFPDLH